MSTNVKLSRSVSFSHLTSGSVLRQIVRRQISRLLCFTFVFTLMLPALAGGKKQDPDIEKVSDKGRIDWTNGSIYATGLGAVSRQETNDAKAYLKARTFAKLDALRNLLMVIDHVRIDSHTVGADFEAQSDTIRAEVQGIVKGAQIVSEREIRKGRDIMVEVTVATRMYGDQGVAHALLPPAIRQEQREARPMPEPEIVPAPVNPPSGFRVRPDDIDPAPSGAPYSSVIIDARGFRLERCMSPKILRQDGSEVWGTVRVDPDYVLEHGIVIYAHSLSDAHALDRCGRNPLVIRACATANSPIPSDAVISASDASKLLSLNARDHFMDKFNVIFIVDPRH